MDDKKEILFLRQSTSGKWLYIHGAKNGVLAERVGSLLISRKHLVEVMKGTREWCVVSAVKEKEE